MLHDVQIVKLLEAKKPHYFQNWAIQINWYETERVVNQNRRHSLHLVKVQKVVSAQSKHILSDIKHTFPRCRVIMSTESEHPLLWNSLFTTYFITYFILFSVNSLDSSAGACSKATIFDKTDSLTCLFLSHCLRFFSSQCYVLEAASLSTSQESEQTSLPPCHQETVDKITSCLFFTNKPSVSVVLPLISPTSPPHDWSEFNNWGNKK